MNDLSAQNRDPRVRLARTGLSMMGFGFVVARFGLFLRELAAAAPDLPRHSVGLSLWLGTGLIVLGVAVNLLAAAEYRLFLKRYERGEPDRVPSWSLALTAALVLSALGVAMIGYLMSL